MAVGAVADVALEGVVGAMREKMLVQQSPRAAFLAAQIADEFLHADVSLHVIFQIVLGPQLLTTPITLERLFVAVHKHVTLEIQSTSKFPATEVTFVHFLVLASVSPKKTQF